MEPTYTPDWNGSHSEAQERARAALLRQDALRPRNRDRGPRKAEDTSAGCLAMADDDRARAFADDNDRMKLVLERSADAWEKRGIMFKRLEAQRGTRDNG